MRATIVIESNALNKDDVLALLQAIRSCETEIFPEKLITLVANLPELTSEETNEILNSIKPPFKYGPIIYSKDFGES
jgi:hypothetical protein